MTKLMWRVLRCNPARYIFVMERKCLANAPCPIARSLDLVGEWWSLLIIREALLGVTRFDDFQKSLGISRNALAGRLKKLVQGGVLVRAPIAEGGRREAYGLTTKGEDLLTVVVAMQQWGDRWLFENEVIQARIVDRATGQALETLEVKSRDGRRLRRVDLAMTAPPQDVPLRAQHLVGE